MFVAKHKTAPFAVTGQPNRGEGYTQGWHQLKGRKKESYRVVNLWTRKVASAEFNTVNEALIHMELLAIVGK
jgi:hypothetical protein